LAFSRVGRGSGQGLADKERSAGRECCIGTASAATALAPGDIETDVALGARPLPAGLNRRPTPYLQYDGLRGYTARAGLDIFQDYCDVAVSCSREGRPKLNALMSAARNHEIDCVPVWKFDRFARYAPPHDST